MSVGLYLLCSVRSYNDSESHSSGLLSIVSELDSALLSSSIPPSIPPLPYSHALYFICLNRVHGFLHYFRFLVGFLVIFTWAYPGCPAWSSGLMNMDLLSQKKLRLLHLITS